MGWTPPFLWGLIWGPILLAGIRRDFNLVGFATVRQALARIFGGTLMGFGASLAGGCSIGSLSGASILSITNWLAIVAMVGGIMASRRHEKVWREEIVRFVRGTVLAS